MLLIAIEDTLVIAERLAQLRERLDEMQSNLLPLCLFRDCNILDMTNA